MNYPGRVRIADGKDEEELIEICRKLHSENALFTINEDKVRSMLRKSFRREGGICGVIGEPGRFEAMIYMLISSFWYSDEPHLEELFCFCLPEYRKSNNAKDMINFAKWCSDQSGFPLIIGVISNERTEGKVRLYQRQLSKPIGNFFFYKKKSDDVS